VSLTLEELARRVGAWLDEPGAREAAELLMARADRRGALPATLTLPATARVARALGALLSQRFVRLADRGEKTRVFLSEFEQKEGRPGLLLRALSRALARQPKNRAAERAEREAMLRAHLTPLAAGDGLAAHVCRRELEQIERRRGRLNNLRRQLPLGRAETEITRRLGLLRVAERLMADPGRLERVSEISIEVAGHTHWLRPGGRPWRELADDLLEWDPELCAELEPIVDLQARRAAALHRLGLVENLTSVSVLLFGSLRLRRTDRTEWTWPEEAAAAGLPIWLSAAHLREVASVTPAGCPVDRVVSVENETSFLDLSRVERDAALVFTAGQANRAVIQLLVLLARSFPGACFFHQGDLDLPGVRILASLARRTGLSITPERMDAGTLLRHRVHGIRLTRRERAMIHSALERGALPCRDLLQAMLEADVRVEQEILTAPGA